MNRATAEHLDEARSVVARLLDNLRPITERHPKELASIEEFNHVLRLAKQARPGSPTIQDMKEFARHVAAIDLLARLSALHGALTTIRAAPP